MPQFFKRTRIELSTDGVFYFAPMTAAKMYELSEFEDMIKAMRDPEKRAGTDGRKLIETLFDRLERQLVDWEIADAAGQPLKFGSMKLDELLTLPEAVELFKKMINANVVGADDAGKSSPASGSSTA